MAAIVVVTAAAAQAQVRLPEKPVPRFCGECVPQAVVLDSSRPPLAGETGEGIQACRVLRTEEEWSGFCTESSVPDCPPLDPVFFAEHSVVVVVVDTVSPRPCEGTAEPLWRLDCVASGRRGMTVRVVRSGAGDGCRCSMVPQMPLRRFIGAAVPTTARGACRACREDHIVDCLQ